MKTRRLAFATVFTALPVLAAVTAAPAAQPTAVGAPTRKPSSHSWLYTLFAPPAAGNRVRPAGYDLELSDSFRLTAARPCLAGGGERPGGAARVGVARPGGGRPPARACPRNGGGVGFPVPIVAPTAAHVPGCEPLPWAAASAGSAEPSGLAASAAPTLTSPGGPVFSLGSTPSSFGADDTAAAAPLAFGPAVAGAPSTRRSTGVLAPSPRPPGRVAS